MLRRLDVELNHWCFDFDIMTIVNEIFLVQLFLRTNKMYSINRTCLAESTNVSRFLQIVYLITAILLPLPPDRNRWRIRGLNPSRNVFDKRISFRFAGRC